MAKEFTQLQRQIMRRVYYAFAIRLATHMTTLHLVLLALAVYALGYFVHVAAVLNNAAAVPLGELGPYLFRTVANADIMTLLVLGVILVTSLSLPFSLPNYHRTLRLQTS